MITYKRVTITLPSDLLELLEGAAAESMRPLAAEIVYRVKGSFSKNTADPKGFELPKILSGENNLGNVYKGEYIGGGAVSYASANYDEAISKIETINAEGYQPTSEEMTELKRYLKERNLQYNPMRRTLDKYENGKWSVVHKFN